MRQILFREPVSGLSVRCDLLDNKALKSTDFLCRLAQERLAFDADLENAQSAIRAIQKNGACKLIIELVG